MKILSRMLLAGVCTWVCASCTSRIDADFQVIPLPQEISLTKQKPFLLNPSTYILYPESNELLQRNAHFLAAYIKQVAGYSTRVRTLTKEERPQGKAIILGLDTAIDNKEGYELTIGSELIRLNGQTENGVFYGIQTLRKAIPTDAKEKEILIPTGNIKDAPRFAYRGMHLDVGRHFYSVEFIKKYIDLLALHNMNTFHWHLTEDQGWRIEIKKYPKLTQVGAMRRHTVVGRNTEKYDNTPHGGFYTQEQAKEIVNYAKERYITIIPEIDLPGHSLAALASYPELGCTGGPYEVCPRWGIFDDVLCIGNEKSMEFLEEVLNEIIEIFPSKYIHIGGDEAPRTRWRECPKCQARIMAKDLRDDNRQSSEDRLQGYCMTRMAKYLQSKGRQAIGWDELMENDVPSNVIIMSWRSMEGGIKAAQWGHDVIMTPKNFCNFDYYQTEDTKDEPLTIGGYVPVEKVYSMEPVSATLTAEQKKHILGVQANLWTEYASTPQQVEYMILPRMAALAEVQWTQPEKKNYKNFANRMLPLMKTYTQLGLNYAKHMFDLKADYKMDLAKKAIIITLNTIDNVPIYYTLDGQEPDNTSTLYHAPIELKKSAKFRAVTIREKVKMKEVSRLLAVNKATFKPIELLLQPTDTYKFKGAMTLVDGMTGGNNYLSGEWLGFANGDVTAIIDLGAETDIQQVATNALIKKDARMIGSSGLIVATSSDGLTYTETASQKYFPEINPNKKTIYNYEVTFDPVKTRYVKIILQHTSALPKGDADEGKTSYLFIDEIVIK